jgi:hypothetical protein
MYGKIERIFQFSKAFPFQVQEVVTCSNLGYNARAIAQSISTWCDILYYYLCLKVTTPQQDAFMVTSDGSESDKCGYSICLPESVPAPQPSPTRNPTRGKKALPMLVPDGYPRVWANPSPARPCTPMWQPAQENTVLSPKTDPLWSLSNNKVSSCR